MEKFSFWRSDPKALEAEAISQSLNPLVILSHLSEPCELITAVNSEPNRLVKR